MTSPAPFIVTAELPPDVFAWAEGLRRAHFPPERNWLSAHVTLVHAFAPSLREELVGVLKVQAARHAPPAASVTGLMNLGRGTALDIRSPGMLGIRQEIAEHFHGAQDVFVGGATDHLGGVFDQYIETLDLHDVGTLRKLLGA